MCGSTIFVMEEGCQFNSVVFIEFKFARHPLHFHELEQAIMLLRCS